LIAAGATILGGKFFFETKLPERGEIGNADSVKRFRPARRCRRPARATLNFY
jgi:hypothetical protein